MSGGLNILGGVGKGLMMGQQQVDTHQRNQMGLEKDRAGMEKDRAGLELLKEESGWKRQAYQEEQEEKQRLRNNESIYREVYSDNSRSELENSEIYAKRVLPTLKKTERDTLLQQSRALKNQFGEEAMNQALLTGDVSGLKKVMPAGSDVSYDAQNAVFTVTGPQGTQQIGKTGLMQIMGMGAQLEQEAKLEKTRAETAKEKRQAKSYDATDAAHYASAQNSRSTSGLQALAAEKQRTDLDNAKIDREAWSYLDAKDKDIPEELRARVRALKNEIASKQQAKEPKDNVGDTVKLALELMKDNPGASPKEAMEQAQEMIAKAKGSVAAGEKPTPYKTKNGRLFFPD